MTVTATEFKTNFGKYLELLNKEDVFITKNGKIIAQVSQPHDEIDDLVDSLIGIAEGSGFESLDDIRDERLKKQW